MIKSTVRFLWVLSGISFLYVLFATYGDIAEPVNMPGTTAYFKRDVYFYGAAALFLVFNVLWLALKNKVARLDPARTMLPNRGYWSKDKYTRQAFHSIMKAWIYALAATTNYLMLVLLIVIFSINVGSGEYFNVPFYHYLLALIVLLLAFTPFIRLSISSNDLLDNRKD